MPFGWLFDVVDRHLERWKPVFVLIWDGTFEIQIRPAFCWS